jgi:hypothetical protein
MVVIEFSLVSFGNLKCILGHYFVVTQYRAVVRAGADARTGARATGLSVEMQVLFPSSAPQSGRPLELDYIRRSDPFVTVAQERSTVNLITTWTVDGRPSARRRNVM